jgi:tetratricopeptide (TPR) repeat protein
MLFIVEDLHWMDPSTLEFLELLVDQSPTAALLLLVTCRPTVHPTWVMRSHVAHVTLDRLQPRLVQEMIGLMPGAHKLPAPMRQHIATATDGVPLFIEEVTKMLLEMGGQRQGALDVPRPARRLTLTIPATLQDLLMARLDRLGTAKNVAQLASAIGREFSYAVLQALAPWDASTLQRDLRRLVEAELLYQRGLPPQGTYLFKHALIRDTAYESLLKRTRQHYHQQIAEVLEAQFPETGELHSELVAHHALRGELWEKAVTYCQQAGTRAYDRAAFREAVAFFDQALQALARLPKPGDTRRLALELRLALGDALNAVGEYERRLALLDEAAALARALDDRSRLVRVCVQIAHVRRITGDSDGAMAAGRQALELAAALGDSALQVEVSHRLGQVYRAIGDFGRAAELQWQNVEEADRESGTSSTELQIRSRASLALTLSALGAFAEGRRHGQEALRLATLAGRGVTPIVAHGCLGIVYLIQGDLEPAIQVLEQGLTLCRASGILDWLRPTLASLGFASALQGRLAEGRALLEEAISIAIHTGGRQRPFWVAWLSEVCRLAGRGEEAWQHARRALDLARQLKDRGDEAVALHQLGAVHAHTDPPDAEQAEAHYQQALTLANDLGIRPLVAHCHLGLGILYAKIGLREQARIALSTAMEMYRSMEMTFWLPQTEAVLAQVEG